MYLIILLKKILFKKIRGVRNEVENSMCFVCFITNNNLHFIINILMRFC